MAYRVKGRYASRETFMKHKSKEENMNPNLFALTLSDGTVLQGLKEKVLQNAKALGHVFKDTEYYESSTKGMIRLKDMDTEHLKNAFCKKFPDYLKAIKKQNAGGHNFVAALTDFSLMKNHNPQLLAMLLELNSRA